MWPGGSTMKWTQVDSGLRFQKSMAASRVVPSVQCSTINRGSNLPVPCMNRDHSRAWATRFGQWVSFAFLIGGRLDAGAGVERSASAARALMRPRSPFWTSMFAASYDRSGGGDA